MGRFIPRGSGPDRGRGKAVWPILLTCGLFLAAPAGLSAQSGGKALDYYVPARSFTIPFTLAENDARIDLLLNCSTDKGVSYRYVATARPQQGRFAFTAPADGWYYFIVQTREPNGVVTPAGLRGTAPSSRICVDTQAPVIEDLSAVANPLPTIRWKITEENLKEILIDYRAVGGDWVPEFLTTVQNEGTHTWKPHWGGELEVRMVAVDKAKNRSLVRTLRLRAADNVSRMPPPQEPPGAGKVMFVHSKTFQLNYTLDDKTIGPSRVASVDIWKLHPGQNWTKCTEKGTPQGPATVSVDAAGRWGFRLIPRSGAGLAERDPQRGDSPDIWVEVDDLRPRVKITNVTVAQEGDAGYITVYWKADDPFLRPMPITIKRATDAQAGNWVDMAAGLPNTGSWRQKTDDLNLEKGCYQFALKVEAIDEAGNVGSDQWGDTVKVDLKIPRINHIHIEAKPGGASSGSGQDAYGVPRTPPYGVRPPDSQPTGRPLPSPINANSQDFRVPKP